MNSSTHDVFNKCYALNAILLYFAETVLQHNNP